MRVKIPISGFVMIPGRLSTCEPTVSMSQLQLSLLDPRRVIKTQRRREGKDGSGFPAETQPSRHCAYNGRNHFIGLRDIFFAHYYTLRYSNVKKSQARSGPHCSRSCANIL